MNASRLVGLALLCIVCAAGEAAADEECFPACRSGYECQAGTCVPAGTSTDCVPPCRSGYECHGGQCVAAAAPAQSVAPTVVRKPKKPPEPPRFEISLYGAGGGVLIGEPAPEYEELTENGFEYGHRVYDVGARLKIRESAAGNAWVVLQVAHGTLRYQERYAGGGSGGVSGDFMLAAEQLFRIPIQGPAYDWGLDRRASLDISVGPYMIHAEDMDLGAQANIQLSLYWLEVGPIVSYGINSGFCAGIGGGVHLAF